MIDTIKLGIPISRYQHKKLQKIVAQSESWQWVQFHTKTGDVRFLRHKGLAKLDQQSFRREIFWDIPEFYREDDTFLTIELSLPKYWYGHNIHLLYNVYQVFKELKKILEKQLSLRLVNLLDWQIWRLDICYAWRCPSQKTAERILDSIKRLHFPRKRPHIYRDSILFAGTTYSLKFYLKLPEFIVHDRKALLKSNARLEWINHLEEKANGVLRCEATLRRKYLKRNGIKTINDLKRLSSDIVFDDELEINYPDVHDNINTFANILAIIMRYMGISLVENKDLNTAYFSGGIFDENKDVYKLYAPPHNLILHGKDYYFKGGGFDVISIPMIVEKLDEIITKLIGKNKGMENIDQIEEKILKSYKKCRASKLIGFWLFVQRKGITAAKELYGRDSFYRCKKDLKEAGVSLVEPIRVIDASDRFIKEFKIELPSSYVTNKFDDYRDSDNILNLPDQSDA